MIIVLMLGLGLLGFSIARALVIVYMHWIQDVTRISYG